MSTLQIRPGHKAIQAYYDALKVFDSHSATHEGAVSTAFQALLATTGQERKWALIPQMSLKIAGKNVRPDGTFRDEWHLPRGYWEAKDTRDDLDAEIKKKIAKGYPLSNTIFEDTRTAVLFQNGQEARRVLLDQPAQLADLLTDFYRHTTPDYEGFNEAVAAFKERIPDLAKGLTEKIAEAHKKNKRFQAAFDTFFELCQTSLNPNIRVEAVDEMLVQHLLTERLFRTIFQNPDFTRRNVIAAEIETVIDALTSGSFSRADFLKSLDTFYVAIEGAAATIQDFSQKQHFLNTVYERFFQGYSVKVADTHGIVYTPQEIVDFMCASVEEVLRTEFGKGLGDEGVTILDPCTGTGNFIVNLMRRIPRKDLERAYKEQLFANEVMLMPYYIAAMNIEHEYYELMGKYEPFEGLCFVDTLELKNTSNSVFNFMNERNTVRVGREQNARVNIVIGNPPYNVGQLNENDNNKNRTYRKRSKADEKGVDDRVSDTYAADSSATNRNSLSDVFVKFFRWATDRLDVRDGIVCFISNNAFLENIAFDGMRKHLYQDFDSIYHIDLRGNVRHNPKLSGTAYNVFGIQVGVGITLCVRNRNQRLNALGKSKDGGILQAGSAKSQVSLFGQSSRFDKEAEPNRSSGSKAPSLAPDPKFRLRLARFSLDWRRETKLRNLAEFGSISGINWEGTKPDAKHSWILPDNAAAFESFFSIGNKLAKATPNPHDQLVFRHYCRGIMTCRDDVVYDFQHKSLFKRIEKFIDNYNSEVERYLARGAGVDPDDFVDYTKLKWSRDLKRDLKLGKKAEFSEAKFRYSLYRPFCKLLLYFDEILNQDIHSFKLYFPDESTEAENVTICLSDVGFRAESFGSLVTNRISEAHLCASTDGHQCFPFYTYDEDGTNRRENITDWALNQFRSHYQNPKISKWDIFHYVYGVLHQPEYRTTFADNLKRELPRIPFMDDFEAFADAGRTLAKWHLEYESVEPWPLTWVDTPGVPLSYEVTKMKLSKDKTSLRVNDWLTLADIPPEVARYRLGNRSALEWVVDQYQVSEDARSGIKSDPNRLDDPEYIVRLVGQVVRVSVETVKIVEGLPGGLGVGIEPG